MSFNPPTGRHLACALVGALLALTGLLMPEGWYDALPTNPEVPPPALKGVTLLRTVLVLEGLVLIALGLLRVGYRRLSPDERLPVTPPPDAGAIPARTAGAALAAITLLALVLRCIELGSDLWLDEVRAVLDARDMTAVQVLASYIRSNVHLLNTLLMKASFAAFGEAEWSARLPVVLFGTASVPALYWIARDAASRGVSLGAALLLAVSYHHILFSQNARGYVPYIFFSLVSSGLLVRGLRDDRPGTWALYVATTVLNFASILISGFVFAAHILVGAIAVVAVRRRGGRALPLGKRLVTVFGITAVLGFQLYAAQIPQIIAYLGVTYASTTAGYWLFSAEFAREMARGLAAGFGPGLLLGALPFLALAGLGFLGFVRRQWTLAAALTLPVVLTAALLFVRDLTVSPRFFLLALPVALLTGVLTVELIFRFLARRFERGPRFAPLGVAVVVALLFAASMGALTRYYAVPLQPYRAALAHAVSLRQPDDVVVAVHTARRGSAYYARTAGLQEGDDLLMANSLEELEAVLATHPPERVLLVTSMPRALRLVHPEMKARIEDGWRSERTFPAIIGDGQISVWLPTGR